MAVTGSWNNFSNLNIRDAVISRFEYQKYSNVSEMEWREIPGFPGYSISSSGLVRHNRSYGNKPRKLVQTIRNNKYFYVTLNTSDRNRRPYAVDRLMIMSFYGLTNDQIRRVDHIDKIEHNNQLENLKFDLW